MALNSVKTDIIVDKETFDNIVEFSKTEKYDKILSDHFAENKLLTQSIGFNHNQITFQGKTNISYE